MSVAIDDQIKCVAREIAMRKNVYPKWVANGRMKQEAADREIAGMEAVIETLKAVKLNDPRHGLERPSTGNLL